MMQKLLDLPLASAPTTTRESQKKQLAAGAAALMETGMLHEFVFDCSQFLQIYMVCPFEAVAGGDGPTEAAR